LQGLLDTEPQIKDSEEVLAASGRYSTKIQRVAMEHVDFEYKKGEPVLMDFNLEAGAGECIALVGETGSGKSSVGKLLCRFYEPTAGQITVDGVDYRQRSLHWFQSNLGVVLQEPHLFSGSILENIRYGRLTATDEEVRSVAQQVGASKFIELSPDGYETQVGEGGNLLSTGQKQLVALARALIADPQILLLDEATSSVDTETERLIQMGIETVLKGRISVIIAHRLSTIRAASRIVVMDKGQIVEQGTHMELLGRRGAYSRLYAQQFRREAAS
jgi:ATP-binding cassette subfamily B protein